MKILIVASHPDDEVLGCGGTIAKFSEMGHEVHVLILGEGGTSRFDARVNADKEITDELEAASKEAAAILNASSISFGRLPDNRFDTVALLDIVKIIERTVEKLSPDVVFTQHGGDLNVDHAMTFRATLTAVRPMQGESVKALYAYEVASSTEWAFNQFVPRFEPDYFVGIDDHIDIKLKAMKAYESETRLFPHPRSPEALIAQARNNGARIGLNAAEAFMTIFRIEA